MGFGVGFRVAPGVRLRATRRGPRMSLGPRIARVHLGGGTSAVSAGKGPITVWQTLSGGGHTQRAQSPSPGSKKAEEWATVQDHLDSLMTAHRQPVTRAERPLAPPPEPVHERTVRRELRREKRGSTPWWRFGERRAGRQRADALLDHEVERRRELAEEVAAGAQREADAWWRALLDNEPELTTQRLERALGDHAMPATVAAVEGSSAHLVIPVAPAEQLIGPREPKLTEAGNLSLARMNKTRRHELYEAAISSATLAVAAEAFAVAPGLTTVDVAVVCPEFLGGPAVLLLAELSRDEVLPDGADRPVLNELAAAAEAGRATLVRDKGGRIGALRPLSDEDPDVRALLDVLDTE
jgi:hypothetical protein